MHSIFFSIIFQKKESFENLVENTLRAHHIALDIVNQTSSQTLAAVIVKCQ